MFDLWSMTCLSFDFDGPVSDIVQTNTAVRLLKYELLQKHYATLNICVYVMIFFRDKTRL